MAIDKKKLMNYIWYFIILLGLLFLYNRYHSNLDNELNDVYTSIQKYLSTDSLADTKKPILWIPINYEYNSRNWVSFGSRSSFELNQPYMYLTVKSIIYQCDESFHICLIDDNSFFKLLPGWNIDMNHISSPLKQYIRILGLTKLIYKYGGIIVPPSFLCMRNLYDLYVTETENNKMFICENIDRNITSTTNEFYADISFMGAQKESNIINELIDFMQRTISNDYTSQIEFLGEFNRWCDFRIKKNKINLIPGKLIGTKSVNDKPILIDDLLSNDYLDLYPKALGIYIPANEILNRRNYEWFARLSPSQVLESNIIISKYILLASIPDSKKGVIESISNKPKTWIGYWQVPSGFGLWGMKPVPFATHLNRTDTVPKP